ncbi:hypothetical protein B0H11DRAFT_2226329 [Mycena galericulata]|nr:hypothetical protein B0H11DRAFT_2226329 [Mycena galericulata]
MGPSTYTTFATTLETIGNALTFMVNVAQFALVPYVQQLISLADTEEIVYAVVSVVKSRVLSPFLRTNVDGLVSLLEKIRDFASEHVSRRAVLRMFTNMADQRKIQDYRAQISQELVVFGLKTQINAHENIVDILGELKNRRPEVPSSSAPPSISGDFSPPTTDTTTSDPPAPQTSTTNYSFENLLDCKIGGTVTVVNVNGDYTTQNSYPSGEDGVYRKAT